MYTTVYTVYIYMYTTSQAVLVLKNLPASAGDQEDPLEQEVAAGSSILAWKIPWREEPGRLQSMELHRVGHH